MHRQSLSSPSSKLHSHGGAKEDTDTVEEPKLRDSVSSASSYDEDDDNAGKSRRASLPPSRTDKFIHLLPILIFCCFLVLYLFSHTPSASEMASFRGFNRSSWHSDSAVDLNNIRHLPVERADTLPILTVENLHEIRPHRKFADF
ncbi:uncharacterized protein LOC129295904 isoform X1 [Prosopis cineraria]|uniref:uncharacterized protein LOC129295904 isoform X1 n=1 Tax=Prosopis cineraria TaxID=364024 RepID=UPI002410387A|nr:uncharacterized protein LOC129295904 isoform X1 [Prosopis cineraria]